MQSCISCQLSGCFTAAWFHIGHRQIKSASCGCGRSSSDLSADQWLYELMKLQSSHPTAEWKFAVKHYYLFKTRSSCSSSHVETLMCCQSMFLFCISAVRSLMASQLLFLMKALLFHWGDGGKCGLCVATSIFIMCNLDVHQWELNGGNVKK